MQMATKPKTPDAEPLWKGILEENVCFLQGNLLLTESVFAGLIQKRILTLEMVDEIKNTSDSDHGRTIELVRCLKRRSDECFDKFLDVLHSTGNTFVADQLEQSMQPSSSRQSFSSDETEILPQAKDRQIHELEEKLAARDRRINQLEIKNENLKICMDKNLFLLHDEMRVSAHYKKVTEALYGEVRNIFDMEQKMKREIGEKDYQVKEEKEKVEELKKLIESLDEKLESVKKNLRIKDYELSIVLEKERRIKKELGLDEDATDQEIMKNLQRTIHSQSEIKRVQDELDNVTREKITSDKRILTLIHEKDNLRFEIHKKDRDISLMHINNLVSAVPTTRSNMPSTTKQLGPPEEIRKPRIDINRYPQLPESVAIIPSIPTRSITPTSPEPYTAALHSPRLQRKSSSLGTIPSKPKR